MLKKIALIERELLVEKCSAFQMAKTDMTILYIGISIFNRKSF